MRSRRALSSMVGAVFFIIAMTVAIGYISYSMDTFDQFAQTVIVKSSAREDEQKEELEVTKVTIDDNLFNITVTNTGQIPMNITRLWVEDVTSGVSAIDAVPKSCDIKESLGIQQVGIKIGQSCTNIPAYDTASYQVKLVTERGTIEEFSINSANQQPLYIQLHTIPDTIPTGFTTTILMTVVNNMSSNNWLPDLKPNTLGISPSCTTKCVKMSGPEPPVHESLEYGDKATFKWVYRLDGDANDSLTFTGSINNGLAGNDASDVVTIKIVEEAEFAIEAVTVLGVGSSLIFLNNVFILHDETELTPGGAYQMDSSVPGGPGLDLAVGPGFSAQWWATNATNNDITVPAGLWDASLRYNSERLPYAMGADAQKVWKDPVGHIFHFNNPTTFIEDSVKTLCDLLPSNPGYGTFGATYGSTLGVNGSGGYRFDGIDDYIMVDWGITNVQCSVPLANYFSMAGWFKADKQVSDAKQVIWGQNEIGSGEFYEISLSDGSEPNHGKLYFRWHTTTAGHDGLIQCEADKLGGGSDGYMDEEWHHFVGVRYDSGGGNDCSCKLYVDGTLRDTNNADSTCGTNVLKNEDDMYMGRDPGSGDYYKGNIDDFMFWSKYGLTADEVTSLFQARFGPKAHEITFVLEKTDGGGATVQILNSTQSYFLPYVDKMRHDENPVILADLWAGANATLNVPEFTLSNSVPNRLNFTMTYVSGMNMTLHIDDTLLDGKTEILSSYIQTPFPDNNYISYFKYDLSDEFVFVILNQGVPGAWYTSPGTRLIFDDPRDITKSYAAIIHFVNGTTPQFKVDDLQDSLWVHSRAIGTMVFWGLKNTPADNAGNEITVGNYDAYIFVNGYDDAGKQFQKTLKLGVVSVVET